MQFGLKKNEAMYAEFFVGIIGQGFQKVGTFQRAHFLI